MANLTDVLIDEVPTVAALWEWGMADLPLSVTPLEGGQRRMCKTSQELRSAARWAFDASSDGLRARNGKGEWRGVSKAAYAEVANVVPPWGPRRPAVAFVGLTPSAIDTARGEPLSGPVGAVFRDVYLGPLGLRKDDVAILHLVPEAGELTPVSVAAWLDIAKAQLAAARPAVVVALGKAASEGLGALATLTLPHPAAVRYHKDSGEVARKIKRIRDALAVRKARPVDVKIAKALPESRVLLGVTLDPYEIDTQEDWCPPFDVQQAAHNFVAEGGYVGLQHQGRADADVVESFTMHYPTDDDHAKAMVNQPHRCYVMPYGRDKVHSGAWVLGVRVNDDDTWEAVLSGEITGFSMGGSGIRTDMDAEGAPRMPEVEFIEVPA